MLDGLGPLLIVHVVAALVAMASGAIVFLLPKGTRRHRRIALVYGTAMIVTTGVVAFVPATTLKFGDSGYGFFHLFIVVGLVSSLLGIFGLYKWRRTRERRWLRVHQMPFSFPATFWATFILANGLILSIAMVMVHRYLAVGDPLRRYAMRPDA